MLLLPAAGCGGGAGGGDTSQPETTAAEVPEQREVALASDGGLVCRVVRGVDATDLEIQAAVTIRQGLLDLFPGSTLPIGEDFTPGGQDSDAVEILVGRTSYDETAAVAAEYGLGNAVIALRGNKIVVFSGIDTALPMLASNFVSTAAKLKNGGELVFTPADGYDLAVSPHLSAIPDPGTGGIPRIVDAGDKAYQVFIPSATAETLEDYAGKLAAAGFEKTADRQIGDSRFTTFIRGDTAVSAYYTASNRVVRIIAEPQKNLYGGSAGGAAVTSPLLTMIGREYTSGNKYMGADANSGLMCFLIRLSDGRFIVVDGGTQDGKASYASAIYAKMLDQAPDPNNIVIAAWFFSHTHSDHIGGFISFGVLYSDRVKLESILLNFPSEADNKAASDSPATMQLFSSAAKTNFPKTPVYKLHTGQNFMISDAEINVWYTHEDFVTKTRSIATVKNNWNNTSLIFSVDLAGQRIMFLGDSQQIPNDLTASVFGDALKSDIVQVAHHGGQGGTKSIYRAIDPEVALFTTSDELVPVYISSFDYNSYLVKDLHLKEYFNAAARITVFRLPYSAKGSGFVTSAAN